jgi:phosphoribosylformylglycinamidine synthase
MRSVIDAARGGMPVLGICNGFQVLCEAGLLPGALIRNAGLKFHCTDQALSVERTDTVWTSEYDAAQTIVIPLKHAEGRYVADEATLDRLEAERRVLVRYADSNPNGSLRDIAGVCSADGRIAGLMPHPEHAIDALTGPGTDGLSLFTSLVHSLVGTAA